MASAIENETLAWQTNTTGNAGGWKAQMEVTHDGNDALQSPSLQYYQEAVLTTWVMGPGTLSFYWKINSTQSYNSLEFTVDAISKGYLGGTKDWIQQTVEIDPGAHELSWVFERSSHNGIEPGIPDAGYIDQIEFQQPVSVSMGSPNFSASPGVRSGPWTISLESSYADLDDLVLYPTSLDESVIPSDSIEILGFGPNRRLYITPADNALDIADEVLIRISLDETLPVCQLELPVHIQSSPAVNVVRKLPGNYLSGTPLQVSLTATPQAGTGIYSITDQVPTGWEITETDTAASLADPPDSLTLQLDDSLGVVEIIYFTQPPSDASGIGLFHGNVSTQTGTIPVYGDIYLQLQSSESRTAWSTREFSTHDNLDADDRADGADPNGDGVTNLLARALGIDPVMGGADQLPRTELAGSGADTAGPEYLSFRFRRSKTAGSLLYQILISNDLVNWDTVDIQPRIIGERGRSWLMEVKIPIEHAQGKYVRLSVQDST